MVQDPGREVIIAEPDGNEIPHTLPTDRKHPQQVRGMRDSSPASGKLHPRESNSGHGEKAVMWILKFKQGKSAVFRKNSSRGRGNNCTFTHQVIDL